MIRILPASYEKLKGRSGVVFKNALVSLLFKGLSILMGFIFVPLYLGAVGERQYGIVLTITSISNFISFFDVGIGNGLRTKLGKAITNNDKHLSRQYVSTSYFYVTILFVSFFLIYCFVAPWIKWYKILNILPDEIRYLDICIIIVIFVFVVRFIFQLIGNILLADQKSALNDSIQFSTSVISLIVCLLLMKIKYLNFYTLILVTCVTPLLVLAAYSIWFFKREYKWLRPSFKYVNHAIRRDLLQLGVKFFLIQIVSIVIFSTTNILIAQLFSINDVTTYNIAFKYYNLTVMVFVIIMSPLWGAFTNAWYQNDALWIKKHIRRYILITSGFVLVNFLQLLIYPYFMSVWLKRDINIQLVFVISLVIYNFVYCYNNIFSHFLASIGKVNKQVYAAIFGGIINIPLTIYLAKYTHLGLSSILYANIICLLPSSIITTIEAIHLLNLKSNEQLIKKGDMPLHK